MLDQWLKCQGKWQYLEPIFSAEEIMKQIPKEGQAFRDMDTIWRRIMEQVGLRVRVSWQPTSSWGEPQALRRALAPTAKPFSSRTLPQTPRQWHGVPSIPSPPIRTLFTLLTRLARLAVPAQVRHTPVMMEVADLPGLLEDLVACNASLDVVEKGG